MLTHMPVRGVCRLCRASARRIKDLQSVSQTLEEIKERPPGYENPKETQSHPNLGSPSRYAICFPNYTWTQISYSKYLKWLAPHSNKEGIEAETVNTVNSWYMYPQGRNLLITFLALHE